MSGGCIGWQEEDSEGLGSHQAEGCLDLGPRGTDCKAPERQAGGQAGNTEGCFSLGS
jgi:hypothetical protein